MAVSHVQQNRMLGRGRYFAWLSSGWMVSVFLLTTTVHSATPISSQPLNEVADHFTAADARAMPEADRSTRDAESSTPAPEELSEFLVSHAESWVDQQRFSSSLQLVTTMLILGLIPTLLLMTTSYVRIVVVLGLLRQAFGAQQLLPFQATTAIAIFMTGLIMWPTWQQTYDEGIRPYLEAKGEVDLQQAWEDGVRPVRRFMSLQIERAENSEDVWLFLRYLPEVGSQPASYDEVPLRALLPAFMMSELKTAFLIGFRIYLPFLVIDLVVAAITTSMGMFMLPPAMVSMPLKLMLFVAVDGWHLVVEMLMQSFGSMPV